MFFVFLLPFLSALSFLAGCLVAFSDMPCKEPKSLRYRLDRAAGACAFWALGSASLTLFAAPAVEWFIAYLMGVVSAIPLALTSLWLIIRGLTTRWGFREEQAGMALVTVGTLLGYLVYYVVSWPWVAGA